MVGGISCPLPRDSVVCGGLLACRTNRGRAEFGFDSFRERYSIVEQDTLDSVDEWRARFRLGYARGSFLRNYFLVEGRTFVGRGDYENAVRVRFTRQLKNNFRSRFSIEGDLTRRTFNEHSTYRFPNDFTRGYLFGYVRLGMGSSFSVRLADRLEDVNFATRTEFDYDYTRNSVILSSEYEWDFTTLINGGVRYTTMSIPDSAEIEYESWTPLIEIRSAPESRRQIYFQGGVERRLYSENATRSSFWGWLGVLNAEWLVASPVGVVIENNIEYYQYDINTNAFFDYVENRLLGLITFYPTWYSRFGVGPSWGFLRSDHSPEDEYDEYGVVFRGEFNRGAKLWTSLQFEAGRRTFPAFDPDAAVDLESVFSDYSYHRLSMFLNWRIWNGVGLNLFVDYQPEDHEREGDDATSTLFSISVSYVF